MRDFFEQFFGATEDQVVSRFAVLKGAMRHKEFVFVPGTRNRRLLLVGHADVAQPCPCRNVEWKGNIAKSGGSSYENGSSFQSGGRYLGNAGLGADDRVGCAMLWTFRNSGHSILITRGEEKGLVGAKAATREIGDLLSEHQFAIEVDRKGDQEMVWYECATDPFKDHIRQFAKGWDEDRGTSTDIAHICPEVGICGVNFAAGYLYEHRTEELFFIDAWERTRNVVSKLLRMDQPRFVLPKKAWRGASWTIHGTNKSTGSGNTTKESTDRGVQITDYTKDEEFKRLPPATIKREGVTTTVEISGFRVDIETDDSDAIIAEQWKKALRTAPDAVGIQPDLSFDERKDAESYVARGIDGKTIQEYDDLLWVDRYGMFTIINNALRYGILTQDLDGRIVLVDVVGAIIWKEVETAKT